MTTYKQGDVLLVPFPFTDQSGTKQRPALVLSGAVYNQTHPDIIIAPITSQVGYSADEVFLNDWQKAGLLKASAVKPILASLETTLVRRKLGEIPSSDLKPIRALFARIFELV